mmetsp:Transcript_16907/g.30640  ORF Transcript_16907/g.30640 Transcript_16907/m.30640 type:complete len:296 (+) Transcript_16907:414-1301(+)
MKERFERSQRANPRRLIVPKLASRVNHVEDALGGGKAESGGRACLDHAHNVRVAILDANNRAQPVLVRVVRGVRADEDGGGATDGRRERRVVLQVAVVTRRHPRHEHAPDAEAGVERNAAASPGAKEDGVEVHIHALPEVDNRLPGEARAEGSRGQPNARADGLAHVNRRVHHSLLEAVEGRVTDQHAREVAGAGDREERELRGLVLHSVSDDRGALPTEASREELGDNDLASRDEARSHAATRCLSNRLGSGSGLRRGLRLLVLLQERRRMESAVLHNRRTEGAAAVQGDAGGC